MLVEFSVGNFWSFKEIQTLQMRAAKISSKNPKLDEDNVVVVDEQLSLLKSKAVFGANGSGKSNLVRGMLSLFYIIRDCLSDMEILKKRIIPYFLDLKTLKSPSFFQIVFVVDDVIYRYGFEANSEKIVSEWLFGKFISPGKITRERAFFTRESMQIDVNENTFKEAKPFAKEKADQAPLYRDNVLFLSVLAAWNVQVALKIIDRFKNLIALFDSDASFALNQMSNPGFKSKVTELLQSVDPTIAAVERFEYGSSNPEAKQSMLRPGDIAIGRYAQGDNKQMVSFVLTLHEAEGTKKLFSLSSYIFLALDIGGVLIIDEFDAKMHPQLTRKIVELFHSPSTNPHNAQLVFITHDTNLLDPQLLRRDQISFAQKDKNGATELYSLVEFKGVRNDASFEKDYLQGKYRAVPTNLNQLEALFENH